MSRGWSLETITCALAGHHTHAAADDDDLFLLIDGGRRFARCIRCDAWLEVEGPAGAGTVLPAHRLVRTTRQATPPARGAELRALALQRVGAVWFALQALVLLLAAIVAALLAVHLPRAQEDARGLLASIGRDTEAGRIFAERLTELLHARPETLRAAAALLTVAAVIAGAVTVGLWLARRWGAYLAVLTTAAFTAAAVSVAGAAATPAVIAGLDIVFSVWLIVDRRLFGVRRARGPAPR